MNLIIESFRTQHEQRRGEYLCALQRNLLHPDIDRVFSFCKPDFDLGFESAKLTFVRSASRLTYLDAFRFCNDNLAGEVCILANSDIAFDETLDELRSLDLDRVFAALSRWDVGEDGISLRHFANPISQDCWIFVAPIPAISEMNFPLGRAGCDNRIARLMYDRGYEVINPSKTIIARHYHQTNYRTYKNADPIPGPYLMVPPSDLSYRQAIPFDDLPQRRPTVMTNPRSQEI